MQFVTLVGLTEPLFLDMEYIRKESLFGERIAPGSLTFGMAEGLTVQTGIIHGTGMAFAGLDKMRLFGPVKVGDTIQIDIEVLDTNPAAKGGDHRLDFVAPEHAIEARLLDVQNLPLDRQNGLKAAVAPLLR